MRAKPDVDGTNGIDRNAVIQAITRKVPPRMIPGAILFN
jgi:hypothetical protein